METAFNFQLRPPTKADIPALVVLRNSWWQALSGNNLTTEAEVRDEWNEPGFDPASDLCVVTTAEGQIVAEGQIHSRSPFVSHYADVHVHPDWQRRGIGSVLTDWIEAQANERLHQAPPDAQVTVTSNLLSSDENARQLLLMHGYTQTRSFHEMDILLDSTPSTPSFPTSITIKRFDPETDKEAAYLAHQDAFHDHYGHVPTPFEEGFPKWWHQMITHPHYDPTTFYLAMDGDQVAGYVFCYPQDYEIAETAWIENLGVRRPWRQRGLGLALLQHAFGEMYQRGQRRIGLGVDADSLTGATRLYEKAGMKTFRRFDRYAKVLRSGVDLTTQTVT